MPYDTFLRRSILAPLVVPLLALIGILRGHWRADDSYTPETCTTLTAICLVGTLLFGGIPYVWMLSAKRKELAQCRGAVLAAAIQKLPMELLPYFWKFWCAIGVACLLSVVGVTYAAVCFVIMVAGAVAVPMVGWMYIGVTAIFLRFYRSVGLAGEQTPS